jgi:hypothetical protein
LSIVKPKIFKLLIFVYKVGYRRTKLGSSKLSGIKFLATLIVLAITALILPTGGGSYSKGE